LMVLLFIQQLQVHVLAGTTILGDKYHLSPRPVSVHCTLLQTIDVNLIATFTSPPINATSIWVEPPILSYFELVVPNDPQRSPQPNAKVEVTDSIYRSKGVSYSRIGVVQGLGHRARPRRACKCTGAGCAANGRRRRRRSAACARAA
jgi:hypothetical protein